VPAELSDESSKDGATKFEDIEGGGIGDGEGVKDVSDQIESEEQVCMLWMSRDVNHVIVDKHCILHQNFCISDIACK